MKPFSLAVAFALAAGPSIGADITGLGCKTTAECDTQAVRAVAAMNGVLDALTVNPRRALEELDDDWTTSMDIAETLQKDHQAPFRVGHGFASAMVGYARANGLRPREFPCEKAVELSAEAIAKLDASFALLAGP